MNSLSSRVTAALLSLLFACASLAPGVRAAGPGENADDPAARLLVPVGHTVGVKLFADGVLVVSLSDGDTPARAGGLREGDIMVTFNGADITSAEQFQQLLAENGGAEAAVGVRRGTRTLTLPVTPRDDGGVRLGAWIRDSMAGIGTVTFYDPASGVFGALGHGVSDVDTGKLMPLESGSIMNAEVKAVKRGESGAPGELRGEFDLSHDSGTLYANTDCGLFGMLDDAGVSWAAGQGVPALGRDEVETGPVVLLVNCAGDAVREYAAEIERIYPGASPTRNLLLRVTDPALLAETGGIVQGMSGAPILQNGKLVGAVTHVLVNDPTRGYGIFIENMLDAAGLAEN